MRHARWARLLAAALLLLGAGVLMGCATAEGRLRIGPEARSTTAGLVYDLALLDLCGGQVDCVVVRLQGVGVSARDALKRATDAQVAAHFRDAARGAAK